MITNSKQNHYNDLPFSCEDWGTKWWWMFTRYCVQGTAVNWKWDGCVLDTVHLWGSLLYVQPTHPHVLSLTHLYSSASIPCPSSSYASIIMIKRGTLKGVVLDFFWLKECPLPLSLDQLKKMPHSKAPKSNPDWDLNSHSSIGDLHLAGKMYVLTLTPCVAPNLGIMHSCKHTVPWLDWQRWQCEGSPVSGGSWAAPAACCACMDVTATLWL